MSSMRIGCFYCEICDVNVQSAMMMNSHVQGKKHMKLQAVRTERQATAEKGIYVRNIPQRAPYSLLLEYFSKFGKVASVNIDKNRGEYAIVEFEDKSTVETVLGDNSHKLNGQRLFVKPRYLKPFRVHRQEKREAQAQVEDTQTRSDGASANKLLLLLGQEKKVSKQMATLMKTLQLTDDDINVRRLLVDMFMSVFEEFFPGCALYQFGSSINGYGTKGCDMDLFLDFKLHEHSSQTLSTLCARRLLPTHVKDIKSLTTAKGGLLSLEDVNQMESYDRTKLIARILSECVPGCTKIYTIPSTRCPVVKCLHEPTGLQCDISCNNTIALVNTHYLHFLSEFDPRIKPLIYTIRYWAKVKGLAGNTKAGGPKLTNYTLMLMVVFFLQSVEPPLLPSIQEMSDLAETRVVIHEWDCSFTTDISKIMTHNTDTAEALLYKFFAYYAKYDFNNYVICPRLGKPVHIVEFFKNKDHAASFKEGPVSVQDPFILEHNTAGNVGHKVRQLMGSEFNKASAVCARFAPSDILTDSLGLVHLLLDEDEAERLDEDDASDEDGTTIQSQGHLQTDKGQLLHNECPHNTGNPYQYSFDVAATKDSKGRIVKTVLYELYDFIVDIFKNVLCLTVEEQRMKHSSPMESETTDQGLSRTESENDIFMFQQTVLKDMSHKRPSSESMELQDQKRIRPGKLLCESGESSTLIFQHQIISDDIQDCTPCNSDGTLDNVLGEPKTTASIPEKIIARLNCKVRSRIWVARRKVRGELLLVGYSDGLDLERAISQSIVSSSDNTDIIVFMVDISTDDNSKLRLGFTVLKGEKEFSCFFNFLKSFTQKIVEKYFESNAT